MTEGTVNNLTLFDMPEAVTVAPANVPSGTEAVHLLAHPGDRVALCGLKDPLPRGWLRFALTFSRPRCEACYAGILVSA